MPFAGVYGHSSNVADGGLGMVAFWGTGQTKPYGERITGYASGQTNIGDIYHRLRFIHPGPSEAIYGTVPGARAVNASELGHADRITGHSDEFVLLDGEGIFIPAGGYRIQLRAAFESVSIGDGITCYQIVSGTDDYLLYKGALSVAGTDTHDPLGSLTDDTYPSEVTNTSFVIDTKEDILLTFIFGPVGAVTELHHNYVLYLERLS